MRLAGAVDIGGTKILLGIAQESGRILISRTFPTITGESGGERSVHAIASELEAQCDSLGVPLSSLNGIGVVCAGPVNPKTGVVDNPYTLAGWDGFPLTDAIKARTLLHARLENDANGMLLGEVKLRSLERERVLMLTFGTGIGVAICEGGALYRGGGVYHPEMGHMIVDAQGPSCYCRHVGCFESLWSGAAINRRSVQAGYEGFDQLYAAYRAGNDGAQAFMARAKRQLANGVWNLMSLVKPDALILGGGFMEKYFDFVADIIREDLSNLTDFVESYRILKAGEAGQSALIGAAELIFAE